MHRDIGAPGVRAGGCGVVWRETPSRWRTDGTTFPIVANWTATSARSRPRPSMVRSRSSKRLGFHSDVTFTVSGPPNQAFQWRIFKRDCTVNVAATGATAFTGLTG